MSSDPAPPRPALPRAILGILLRVAAMAFFAGLSALVKWTGERGVPVFQIIFFRNAFAFIPILIYIARTSGFGVLRIQHPGGHIVRSGAGLFSMVCGFSAIQHLSLTAATAFAFATPLFMTALSAPILKEPVGRHRWGAVVVGFIGVLIMIRPEPGQLALFGAGLALSAAVASAFAMIAIRQMSRTEPGAAIAFYFTAAGTVLGLLSLPFGWVVPDALTLGLLILAGLLGGIGQLLQTEALRLAPVGVVAAFDYTQLLWATLLGLLIWGDLPAPATAAGAAVVAVSGGYILWRETRRFMRRD